MWDLGATVPLATDLTDSAGDGVNADTAVLTITLPDGSTVTPSVSTPATDGEYRVNYVPTQVGRHTVRWVFAGPAAAVTDVFDVRPGGSRQLISLKDAREHLNKVSVVDDDELRGMINAATAPVEDLIGPVVRRTVTDERHTSRGQRVLELLEHHVLVVESVTYVDTGEDALDVDDLDIRGEAGQIRLKDDTGFPRGGLLVTYVVGRTVVDESIVTAAGIIVNHLWETQRGGKGRPAAFGRSGESAGPDDLVRTPSGFLIPNRAAQLLEPHAPVIA